MSKHLHSRIQYCFVCSSVATEECRSCGMPICLECSLKYDRKCDICSDDIKEENLVFGSGNEYKAANKDQVYV